LNVLESKKNWDKLQTSGNKNRGYFARKLPNEQKINDFLEECHQNAEKSKKSSIFCPATASRPKIRPVAVSGLLERAMVNHDDALIIW